MNAPERAAAFLLDEDNGEVKIEYSADTKVSLQQRLCWAQVLLLLMMIVPSGVEL